jgi:hypothetical protein
MRNATRVMVSTMGAIMGLAGLEHGTGEILQGNVAPRGIMFPSWPDAAFFRIVAGEPAMTLVPNLLVTGILTVLVSLILLVWATLFVQRPKGGLVMILLCLILLLVGGGIFPPIIGIMLGGVGTQIHSPVTRWHARPSVGLGSILAKMWPGLFVACVVAWLLLFPGINLLGYFFGVNDPNLTVAVIFFALGSLLLTTVSGLTHDAQRRAA